MTSRRPSPKLVAWLKQRREELELSRAQVAVRARGEVSADHLRKIEYGERMPSANVLGVIAPIYRVDPAWLMRLAGYLPESAAAPEPAALEPPEPVAWEDIERMILELRDLTLDQKRQLIPVWKAQYEAMRQAATDKRHRERKASG